MNLGVAIGVGTFHPDGTLELDQKLNLPAGRVQVTLQPVRFGAIQRGLADVIDEIHRRQLEKGFVGRSAEMIESGLREGK